jgi:hypothetical protein
VCVCVCVCVCVPRVHVWATSGHHVGRHTVHCCVEFPSRWMYGHANSVAKAARKDLPPAPVQIDAQDACSPRVGTLTPDVGGTADRDEKLQTIGRELH